MTNLEIRTNDDGTLDEIVATGAYIHLEQMAANVWLLIIEADGREMHVSLYTQPGDRSVIKAQVNEWAAKTEPTDG